MALAYGKPTGGYGDPDVVAINRCVRRLGIAIRPGVWKVTFTHGCGTSPLFPRYPLHASYLSRYVPGYLKELQDGLAEELALFRKHLEDVRQQIVRSSFLCVCILTTPDRI